MSISFVDDNFKYVKSYIMRNYDNINDIIYKDKDLLSFFIENNGFLAGYTIVLNKPLSEIYNFNCYVVKFSFVNVSTLHIEEQQVLIEKLVNSLKEKMIENEGYYNVRVPSNIVDLMKAINNIFSNYSLCGGTVEEYIYNKSIAMPETKLKLFFADDTYIRKYKEELLKITYDSFKTYQGQYHISNLMDEKAGEIYENWIKNSFSEKSNEKIVIAEYEDMPIGFVTIGEDDFAVEGILSAVSVDNRKLGAYKNMISYIINYAYKNQKAFITSTQFDNYIVQGVWNSLGLKPFYSIYNLHFDYTGLEANGFDNGN